MDTHILGLLSRWITIITISVSGLINVSLEQKQTIDNTNQTKNSIAAVTEIDYTTTTTYNDKLPKGVEVTKQKGKQGLAYQNEQIIEESQTEIIEIGTGEETNYVGKLTGYGADCQGCTGVLSCKTKNGDEWNLIANGNIYTDEEYGKVKILAAALEKFPCGTIIEVTTNSLGTFTAIVLDTGSAMISSWNKGIIHMDLAYQTENDPAIALTTNSNVKYNVKRWGW